MVGFRLRERVVQDDVDDVTHRLVRVDLGDHNAVAVLVEHLRHAEYQDVVVVNQRNPSARRMLTGFAFRRRMLPTTARMFASGPSQQHRTEDSSPRLGCEPLLRRLRQDEQRTTNAALSGGSLWRSNMS
jgi:hypothetical protein